MDVCGITFDLSYGEMGADDTCEVPQLCRDQNLLIHVVLCLHVGLLLRQSLQLSIQLWNTTSRSIGATVANCCHT